MVVDSSVWLEILRAGPLHQKCQRAIQRQHLRIPSLVMFEVYKKLKQKTSEDVALEAMATFSQYEVLVLDREVSMLGGDLAISYSLPMADALVLAHAVHLDDVLLTLDNDFADLPNTKILR